VFTAERLKRTYGGRLAMLDRGDFLIVNRG